MLRRPLSSVRPPFSKIFFSKTAGPIKAKSHKEPSWVRGTKVCLGHLGHESGSFRPLSRSPLSRFAHFPFRPESFRPRVVSPTFPFAPESFRPLPRSPLSRFAPYEILFLVLLFRPQKWYKALFFLAYWWFFVITYKRWKKNWAFYTVFWKVTQQSSYVKRNPDLFSVFCVHISHELLWHRKSVFYIVRILSISYFVISSEPMDISIFKIHMSFTCFCFPEIHLLLNWH